MCSPTNLHVRRGVVHLGVKEQALLAPREPLGLDVEVLVVWALRETVVLLKDVLVVLGVLALDLVHVHTKNDRARNEAKEADLAPELSRL